MNQDYKIFLDTNILVHASLNDYDKDKYLICSKILKKIISSNFQIFISTQILREFFAVVTNKKYLKNPLSVNDANKQIRFFINNFNILPVNEDVINQLLTLTEKYNVTGQNIHDTTIVASMLEFGLVDILTYNKKDFEIFREIKVIIPEDFNI